MQGRILIASGSGCSRCIVSGGEERSKIEISAGGVVFRREGREIAALLITDRFGRISLPKGKMEPGETIEQTALREIAEETGLQGVVIEPLECISYQYLDPACNRIDKQVHYFLVEAVGGQLQPQLEEINLVQWFSPREAWNRQQSKGYNNNHSVLRKALLLLGYDPDLE